MRSSDCARCCSFTKTAARIGVAQSTLSHAVRLEARLGIRGLTRSVARRRWASVCCKRLRPAWPRSNTRSKAGPACGGGLLAPSG
ncbi:helix-turn-helix domain-containing protein [Brevundimonas intermedia]|uniref:helix-turn-helix domain-containing protein n=1 Tax=Brevundimonas intermedia TaxID=74315 RepID=UPI003D3519AC